MDEMVEHRTGAEIRALRKSLEQATNQIRSKDHQIELMRPALASTKFKVEESTSRLKTAKMQVWGLLVLCALLFISMNKR